MQRRKLRRRKVCRLYYEHVDISLYFCPTEEALPLESVLEDPIYSLAEEEDTEALPANDAPEGEEPAVPEGPMGCMLCPNKVLKNEKMVEVHLASKVS